VPALTRRSVSQLDLSPSSHDLDVSHLDLLVRFVIRTHFRIFDRSDHLIASGDATEDRVFVVQPRGGGSGDKELEQVIRRRVRGRGLTCEPLVLGPALAIDTVKGRS
jgi:hypothetical protein